MKNEIIILIIILITAANFGCTSNTESKKDSKIYGSDYVNFQMPEGWEVHPMPGEGTVIWMKGDPRIRVIDLKNKEKSDSEYNKALNSDTGTYNIKKETRSTNGIDIKVIKTIHNNNGDIQDKYFLQKNNKYYCLICWAFPGWNSKKQISSRKEIDRAVDTIVTTIN
jgi:hypothetical protein